MFPFSRFLFGALSAAFFLLNDFHTSPVPTAPPASVLGRWEVVRYAEQGVQVDKRQPALLQALSVYQHVREERIRQWYGYYDPEEASRRERRNFEEWEQQDSVRTVQWAREMIETPCYVVFFADSTVAIYNKNARTNGVSNTRTWHYVFHPNLNSLEIAFNFDHWQNWYAQVLSIDEQQVTLFIPNTAEVVELVRAPYSFP